MSTRYQLRQRLLAFEHVFWVEDSHGRHVFRVDGRVPRPRNTLELESAHGEVLCRIVTSADRVGDTWEIEGPDGLTLACVRRVAGYPHRDRWSVEVSDDADLGVRGDVAGHDYLLVAEGQVVAEVSRRWFRTRGSYGLQVADDRDRVLVLAVALVLDAMSHPKSS